MIKKNTVIFMLLAVMLIISACSSNTPSQDVADTNIKTINVNSFRFGYEPSVIEVKLGEPVRLILTTSDVAHGFYVRELGIDETISPNKETIFEFTPSKLGEFDVSCDIYCGDGHSDMKAKIKVIEWQNDTYWHHNENLCFIRVQEKTNEIYDHLYPKQQEEVTTKQSISIYLASI